MKKKGKNTSVRKINFFHIFLVSMLMTTSFVVGFFGAVDYEKKDAICKCDCNKIPVYIYDEGQEHDDHDSCGGCIEELDDDGGLWEDL